MRLLIGILLLIRVATQAQTPDSLLYSTPFEKEIFLTRSTKEPDPTALFIAFDSDTDAYVESRNRLEQFYRYVDQQGLRNKPDKVFAKNLFKAVHEMFFVKYEDISPFSKIFKNGYYNCVSATALFAIILDHYNVPYQVKEVPTHVYLVAYPGTHNILYEATNPKGFYAPDNRTKETYVNDLVKMKMVTQEYVSRVGYPKAFEEMYYSKDNVNLTQLASFQYYNQALVFYQDKKIDEAIPYALKAYTLNPSTKNEYLKISLIGEHLSKSDLNGPLDIVYLIELGNTLRDESVKQDVVKTFQNYIYQKLFKNSNDSIFLASYQLLKSSLRDSTLKEEITQLYNIGLTQWYGSKGKLDESLKYARLAYQHNPNDATIHENISTIVIKRTATTIGNANNLKQLTAYKEEFPFLADNNYFMSLFAHSYAYLSYKNFNADQEEEGYKYMKLLEEEMERQGKESLLNESMIAMVYAEAGAHHYRQREYRKAKEIIMKGFKYAPEDGELKARLEIVEKELN